MNLFSILISKQKGKTVLLALKVGPVNHSFPDALSVPGPHLYMKN